MEIAEKTPFKLSPTLGQHAEEVLTELLEYSKEEIAELRAERVI